jgi:hypothetical protein
MSPRIAKMSQGIRAVLYILNIPHHSIVDL